MGGKGKGKGGPPPPPPSGDEGAKAVAAELQQRQKREAQEAIAHARALEAKKRDLETRLPMLQSQDIALVPWDTALLGTHLAGGKGTEGIGNFDTGSGGGIDVVELAGGTAVCVRKGTSIITEVIADALAEVLGVRVARMRLVNGDSEEGRTIREVSKRWMSEDIGRELARLEKQLPMMDTKTAANVKAWLNWSAHCAVVEFVPGTSLGTAVAALEAPSPGLLAGLGHLCALDLLLNNMDRMPLPCWGNDGNLTNAIVTTANELVGIDQQVRHIDPGPSLDAYLGKVRNLSAKVLQGSAPAITASIRTAISKHCGVDLSDGSLELVIEGMGAVLRKVALEARSGLLRESMAAAVAKVEKANLSAGPVDPASIAVKDVVFVEQVIDAVVKAAEDQCV